MLVVARHSAKDLALIPIAHNDHLPHPGRPIVLADSYNGTRLNAPNVICVDSHGNIFFSDAYFELLDVQTNPMCTAMNELNQKEPSAHNGINERILF